MSVNIKTSEGLDKIAGNGGGPSKLEDIKNVDAKDIKNNDILQYNSETKKWENRENISEQDISDMGFTKNTGNYNLPDGGIPKTDLSSDVQNSLKKADTALQTHQDISGKQDKGYYLVAKQAGDATGTIDGLYESIRGTSGGSGSVSLQKKASGVGSEIPSGWYNYSYMPHRHGIGSDNPDFATITLYPMTFSGTSYIVRCSGGKVAEVKSITTTNVGSGNLNIYNPNGGLVLVDQFNANQDGDTNLYFPTYVSNAGTSGISDVARTIKHFDDKYLNDGVSGWGTESSFYDKNSNRLAYINAWYNGGEGVDVFFKADRGRTVVNYADSAGRADSAGYADSAGIVTTGWDDSTTDTVGHTWNFYFRRRGNVVSFTASTTDGSKERAYGWRHLAQFGYGYHPLIDYYFPLLDTYHGRKVAGFARFKAGSNNGLCEIFIGETFTGSLTISGTWVHD